MKRLVWLASTVCMLHAADGWAQAKPKPSAEALAVYQRHTEVASKLFQAQAFDAAAAEYEAAYASAPKVEALRKVVESYRKQNASTKARDAAQRLLQNHGKELKKPEKKELEALLGTLDAAIGHVDVKVDQPGAEILIDGVGVGTSPLAKPLELDAGAHAVGAKKAGFEVLEQPLTVEGGKAADLQLSLETEITKGQLSVTERAGTPLDVLVDGVKVGATPWKGDVALGTHQVAGGGAAASAPPQTVEVVKRKEATVVLAAVATTARLAVTVTGPKAVVRVDGKPLTGPALTVPLGAHVVEVSREGFVTETRSVIVPKEGTTAAFDPQPATPKQRPFKGVYGSLMFMGLFQTSRTGNQAQVRCGDLGGTGQCDSIGAKGGGIGGYVGYTWNPVGVEVFLAGSVDVSRASSQGTTGDDRRWDIVRTGGIAGLRARGTYTLGPLRGSLAVGPAVAERVVIAASDATTYTSLAFVGDASIAIRASQTFAIAIGCNLWFEHAGHGVVTDNIDGSRTPFFLVSGPQVQLLPYLGLQFGP